MKCCGGNSRFYIHLFSCNENGMNNKLSNHFCIPLLAFVIFSIFPALYEIARSILVKLGTDDRENAFAANTSRAITI